MVAGIKFDRTPYKVTYYKDGEKHTIRRRPPPLLHNMLPKDEVRLTRSKNADFQAGKEFTVKHINPRHPNVLQLQDAEGQSTFVDYYDLAVDSKKEGRRVDVDPIETPERNKYLLWP